MVDLNPIVGNLSASTANTTGTSNSADKILNNEVSYNDLVKTRKIVGTGNNVKSNVKGGPEIKADGSAVADYVVEAIPKESTEPKPEPPSNPAPNPPAANPAPKSNPKKKGGKLKDFLPPAISFAQGAIKGLGKGFKNIPNIIKGIGHLFKKH